MKKQEYAAQYGITIRPATKEDQEKARTDYQRNAAFMLECEWANATRYSTRGTLQDVKQFRAAIAAANI